MQALLIIALLIAILAVIFALQNAIPVSITFLVWKTEGSLALVLLVALAVGRWWAFWFLCRAASGAHGQLAVRRRN